MLDLLILFAAIFILNIIPVFVPPTWISLSYVGFKYPLQNVMLVALVGATAATLGRLTLSQFSRAIIRRRFLSQRTRDNIDAIRKGLEHRRTLTFSVCLIYAFSPLPSNYLFIAYGLTSMGWRLIAIPFFIGRFAGYSLWIFAGSTAARNLAFESVEGQSYLGVYYLLLQVLLLGLLYLFTRIDWQMLLAERKLRWTFAEARRSPSSESNENSQ